MIGYVKAVVYAVKLGFKEGYNSFCSELMKYRNYRLMQKRKVF